MNSDERIKDELIATASARSATFCPSEVARALYPNSWRDKMEAVRTVADALVANGQLEVLQKGEVIREMPTAAKGPIRLRAAKTT